jgi:hypothetical protein
VHHCAVLVKHVEHVEDAAQRGAGKLLLHFVSAQHGGKRSAGAASRERGGSLVVLVGCALLFGWHEVEVCELRRALCCSDALVGRRRAQPCEHCADIGAAGRHGGALTGAAREKTTRHR